MLLFSPPDPIDRLFLGARGTQLPGFKAYFCLAWSWYGCGERLRSNVGVLISKPCSKSILELPSFEIVRLDTPAYFFCYCSQNVVNKS